jgi:hypothetical protein
MIAAAAIRRRRRAIFGERADAIARELRVASAILAMPAEQQSVIYAMVDKPDCDDAAFDALQPAG